MFFSASKSCSLLVWLWQFVAGRVFWCWLQLCIPVYSGAVVYSGAGSWLQLQLAEGFTRGQRPLIIIWEQQRRDQLLTLAPMVLLGQILTLLDEVDYFLVDYCLVRHQHCLVDIFFDQRGSLAGSDCGGAAVMIALVSRHLQNTSFRIGFLLFMLRGFDCISTPRGLRKGVQQPAAH